MPNQRQEPMKPITEKISFIEALKDPRWQLFFKVAVFNAAGTQTLNFDTLTFIFDISGYGSVNPPIGPGGNDWWSVDLKRANGRAITELPTAAASLFGQFNDYRMRPPKPFDLWDGDNILVTTVNNTPGAVDYINVVFWCLVCVAK